MSNSTAEIKHPSGGTSGIHKQLIPGVVLDREIGSGATAIVYLAHDTEQAGRRYAVKILTRYLVTNQEARKRWDRETELLLSLNHPNIVQGIRAGVSGQRPYLVMEYLQGETLAARLRRMGKLPREEVLAVARAALEALSLAHKKNIIHRDVKPANLMRLADGTIKLTDFGLARFADDTSITTSGMIVGTPMYISPEQARGDRKVSSLSDLYSLGVTLYHLACGQPPFAEFNTSLLLTRKSTDEVPDVRLADPSIGRSLAFFIGQMCRRNVFDRLPNARAALDLLDQVEQTGKEPTSSTETVVPHSSLSKLRPVSCERLPEADDVVLRALSNDTNLQNAPRFIEPGEVLFYEDEGGTDCYILLEGCVELLRAGRRVALVENPGSFLGELSALREIPRPATAAAVKPTIVLLIEKGEFEHACLRHPGLALRLAQGLAQQLEECTLRHDEAEARLAALRNHIKEMSGLVG